MFSKRTFSKHNLGIAVLVVATVLAVSLGTGALTGLASTPSHTAAPVFQTADETDQWGGVAQLGSNDQLFNTIYTTVSPSVVSINVVSRQPGTGIFGSDQQVIGSGTGFVVDTQGHIVTNNHVVDGATQIEVNFIDGTIVPGKVVGTDPDSDLAVISVDLPAGQLHPVTFGDSDQLFIGQTVLAIGSPFNQRWTLTSGIVSALERTIQGLTNFSIGSVIQTDASINPGNSGGPLLDLNGNVIGVNSQIISPSRTSSGVGFAIPSNLAKRVAEALITKGSVDYSYLGIRGGDVSLAVIESLGLKNNQQGVVVSEVTAGGPAERAGLRSYTLSSDRQSLRSADIITAINGTPLRGISDLISYLAKSTQPGQTVTLSVLRDGSQQLELPVDLSARPAQ